MRRQRGIEFVGGPFDGHCEFVSERRAETSETLAVPVSKSVLSRLGGRSSPQGLKAPITSVAIYQLQKGTERWCYHYVESWPPVESST